MTTAGQLRDRITVQKMGSGVDEWGTPLPTDWQEYAKVWANFKHLTGSESIRSGADTSIVKASVRVRFRKDIDASMRVQHLGFTYDIEAVLPDDRRVFMDLICKRVT